MNGSEESARQPAPPSIEDVGVRCLDDEEVLAFLDRRLAGARLRAVERHLDDCDACRVLVGYVARDETNLSATLKSTDRGLRAGDTVDHFRIERRIGVGGMGEIYLATDTNLLRPVALKLIAEKLIASTEARDRLLVEARATARITHPGIVQIHSVGVHAGRPYLALEHIEGETLKAYLDRGRPKLFEILDMGVQLADALAAAHAEGVLHRDLKPHNVIIGRDGRVRVLDFGLAKVRPPIETSDEDDLSSWYEITQADPGSVRGTPGYMAPEQWKNDDVTSAADVWGLGVILYEMISGDRPYRESSAISYAVKVCDVGPVPPLADDAGAPADLRHVVEACLSKDVADRPSAVDVANTLRAIAADDAVQLARELDDAAGRWSTSDTTGLWRGAALERAEQVLRSEPFVMDARSTRFLTASVHEDTKRHLASRARLRALGGIALGFGVLASVFLWQNVRDKAVARAERDAAEVARAETLIESADTDWSSGRALEARAKLRSAIAIADAPRARVLLWKMESAPLVWSHDLGTGLYDIDVTVDLRHIVAAAHDGTVYVVDADTHQTDPLRGLDDQALEVAVAPNGRAVAAVARSGRLMVWDLDQNTKRALGHEDGRLDALAFTEDGRQLVGAQQNNTIVVFDLRGAKDPLRWSSTARIFDLVVHDGAIFSAEADGQVRVYDLATHVERRHYTSHTEHALLTVDVRDGTVVAGDQNGGVHMWSADGTHRTNRLSHRAIQRVVLGDGVVFAAGTDRVVRRWTFDDDQVREVASHDGGVWGLAAIGSDTLVSGSLDGTLMRTRWDRVIAPQTKGGHTDGVTAVAFSPDGRSVMSGGYDRLLRTWDAVSGRPLRVDRGHDGTIYDVVVGRDVIVTASHDRTARVWKDGASKVLVGHADGVYAVQLSPDESAAYTASADGTARRWDLERLVPTRQFEASSLALYTLAVDRGRLVTAGGDGKLHVFTDRGHAAWTGHHGAVWGVAFGANDAIVSAGYDGTVRRWDRARGGNKVVGRVDGRLYDIAVDPSSGLIAVVGADRDVHILGDRPRVFRGHRSEVNSVRFSPDGQRLVTGSDDGTVRVWDVETGRAVWQPNVVAERPDGVGRCYLEADGTIRSVDGSGQEQLEARWTGAERIVRSPTGCIVQNARTIRWYGAQGAHRDLITDADAMTWSDAHLLVVSQDRLIAMDEKGRRESTTTIAQGVTAVSRFDDITVLGFDNGRIEVGASVVLDATPSAVVTTIVPGPGDTIAAGFTNGGFGVWDRTRGTTLYNARLHGAIVQIDVTNAGLRATSELGDHVTGPERLADNHCTIVRRAMKEVPVIWSEGRAIRAKTSGDSTCKFD